MNISRINEDFLEQKNISLSLLRLDQLHPTISGNKWFKLKYNIDEAIAKGKSALLSFGGAYSNHLHALAYAGLKARLKTIGIIRGESVKNDTLQDCINWGMDVHFMPRNKYAEKKEMFFLEELQNQFPYAHIISEGGFNSLGIKGCEEILLNVDIGNIDFICCSVGSGATILGLVNHLKNRKKVLGFFAVKNAFALEKQLREESIYQHVEFYHDYHYGGFAKQNKEVFNFIQAFNAKQNIELDFIYNAKMILGIYDLINKGQIPEGANILAIHTGGLQGNRSLDFIPHQASTP